VSWWSQYCTEKEVSRWSQQLTEKVVIWWSLHWTKFVCLTKPWNREEYWVDEENLDWEWRLVEIVVLTKCLWVFRYMDMVYRVLSKTDHFDEFLDIRFRLLALQVIQMWYSKLRGYDFGSRLFRWYECCIQSWEDTILALGYSSDMEEAFRVSGHTALALGHASHGEAITHIYGAEWCGHEEVVIHKYSLHETTI